MIAHAGVEALVNLAERGGVVHGTAVSAHRRALLIVGPAGSGKSSIALAMMALGAGLIADDRTLLCPVLGGAPRASAPQGLPPAIEALGLGLLIADLAAPAAVAAVVDLSHTETERMPPERRIRLLGYEIELYHNIASPYFPAALMQYLAKGRAPL